VVAEDVVQTLRETGMISFKFKVTQIGPDTFEEKVKRSDGKEVVASIPCCSLELVSEDESAGTISLWLTKDQMCEMFGGDCYQKDPLLGEKCCVEVGAEVDVSFGACCEAKTAATA
jgi:hypothetical protein